MCLESNDSPSTQASSSYLQRLQIKSFNRQFLWYGMFGFHCLIFNTNFECWYLNWKMKGYESFVITNFVLTKPSSVVSTLFISPLWMLLLTPLWEEVFFVTVCSGLPKWLEINSSHLVKRLKIESLFTNYPGLIYHSFSLSSYWPVACIMIP